MPTYPLSEGIVEGQSDHAGVHNEERDAINDLNARLAIYDATGGGNLLTTGQDTFPRDGHLTGNVQHTSGSLRFTYFTSRKSETVSKIRVCTGTTPAGATPTLIRFALYSVASNGDLTLVAATANDTTLLTVGSTFYEKSFATPVAVVAGQRYAFAVLVVSGATMPMYVGVAQPSDLYTAAPRITGALAAQTDIPASVLAGSVAVSQSKMYAVILP